MIETALAFAVLAALVVLAELSAIKRELRAVRRLLERLDGRP